MRLGIRRKLIGTLMLVGLLPLALSLFVILGGGATLRLHSIRNAYQHKAADAANQIAAIISHEVEKLRLIARLPSVRTYTAEKNLAHAQRRGINPAALPSDPPAADEPTAALDRRWSVLTVDDEPLRTILNNPFSLRLRELSEVDRRRRQILATDAFGEIIAATDKPGDYHQSDEDWWQAAYRQGQGRVYVSSVVENPASGTMVVAMAVPIFEEGRLIGILKDKIDVAWLRQPLQEAATELDGAAAQLFDARLGRAVLVGDEGPGMPAAGAAYLAHGPDPQGSLISAVLGDLIIGATPVPLDRRLAGVSAADAPRWVVILSRPAPEAMVPVYRLAMTVAAIGIALILILFILGVAIANREIILPILRLREATAAVGRGELNTRLMSEPGLDGRAEDPTFRADELGELARDFDHMTRDLQKNLGQLARNNEAKRRFMELAGHELRTPVTYILGVCELTQRQLQAAQHADESNPAPGQDGGTPVLARSTGGVGAALAKVSAKTQRLSRIIENLLKLVQNDQFTTRLVKQPLDMRALILQVCNEQRPFASERQLQLLVEVAENLPTVEGDRDKLEDALTNLVSNAIRFSPNGATVRVVGREVVGDMLEILVEDAGPGISPQDAANLFEPFYTGTDIMHHHSGTYEYGSKGIGLGLAIVRRFIEIHGGVVRVQPRPEVTGTQFQILLPLPPRDGENDAPAR